MAEIWLRRHQILCNQSINQIVIKLQINQNVACGAKISNCAAIEISYLSKSYPLNVQIQFYIHSMID